MGSTLVTYVLWLGIIFAPNVATLDNPAVEFTELDDFTTLLECNVTAQTIMFDAPGQCFVVCFKREEARKEDI